MRWTRKICLFLALAPAALAFSSAPKLDPAVLLDASLRPFVESRNLVGIVAGVQMGDRAVLRSYGSSGRPGLSMDPDTLFEIASVSKTFTGTLLAELLREGKIGLEDPLQKYMPGGRQVPVREGRSVTLLDMVTHTSGLPVPGPSDHLLPSWHESMFWRLGFAHLVHLDFSNPFLGVTDSDIYDMISKCSLHSVPGTRWEYSNIGMGTLGMVLAGVDGQPQYEGLVKKRVIGPLGMNSTTVTLDPALSARLAEGYTEAGKKSAHLSLGILAGAGGLKSSLNDLMTYLNLHMGRLKDTQPALTASALSMQRIYRTLHEPTYTRQLPLAWHYDAAENIYYHSGTGLGYHSYIGFNPKTQVGIVLLANSAAQVVEEIGPELIKTIEGRPARIPKPLVAVALPPEKLKELEGEYKFADGKKVVFKAQPDSLSIDFGNKKPSILWPRDDRSFFCKEWDCRVQFTEDAKGKVNGADVKMYYNTYHAGKL